MAGHSKWANIKHRKGRQDAEKGKIFNKINRAIALAVREGGTDLNANSKLRHAYDLAFAANMSKDIIERAIKKAQGNLDADNSEEVRYEGYGPGGTAVMVDCLTNNRNRTVSEVRHAFTKHGGKLGLDGSVSYLFTYNGNFLFNNGSEDTIMEIALNHEVIDLKNEDGVIEVISAPEHFAALQRQFIEAGFKDFQASLTYLPILQQVIEEASDAEQFIKLMDALEECDDVQNVYTNAALAKELASAS